MIPRKFFYLVFMVLTAAHGFAEQKKPTVVVIGAGIAGLTTAYRLHQQGVDVHIYEAHNRVGGRIFSVKVGNTVAELGGQNIADGGNAENIRRFIEDFHLELIESRHNLRYSYFHQGTLVPESLLHKESADAETLKSQIDEAVQNSKNMRDVFTKLFKEDDPLYKVLSVRLTGYEGGSIETLSPLYAETLYHMLLGGLCSVHHNKDEAGNYLDLVSIKGGNALLPEKLAQSLGSRVHLNMPLVAVSKDQEGSYALNFKNGQKVKVDILVLAIPCSVYEDITFEKDLIPEERLQSIKNVHYGINAKLLVPFSQPPEKRETLINDQMGSWFDADRRVLTLYYTGEAARFSAQTISEVYNQARPMLEYGYKDQCPPFVTPTLARDESLAAYEGPVGHSWPNDPYAKGTYSYIASGQETLLTATSSVNGETVKTLFAPIGKTLYFAGEHATILLEVPGTMEAACESGERTARMIKAELSAEKKSG